MSIPAEIEVLTLFVDDLVAARHFYRKVFAAKPVYVDDVSSVLEFGNLMINLLQSSEAPELVHPANIAAATSGASMMLTVQVQDVDAVCAKLHKLEVALLNGPHDQPWGRRPAAFADPAGHVWEVAHTLNS